jgi:hypothetical protein
LNSRLFSRVLPYLEPFFSNKPSTVKPILGKGGVLSSDIVQFVQFGINVASKIGADPAKVRTNLVLKVNRCFVKSGSEKADYQQKIGSDGWFHFYKDPASSQIINLALDCSVEINKLSIKLLQRWGQNLQVVMGVNAAQNVQLDPMGGGPLDDDSIMSIRLLKEEFKQYDVRATEKAVLELVDSPSRNSWTRYGNLSYPDGRNIVVYGHT